MKKIVWFCSVIFCINAASAATAPKDYTVFLAKNHEYTLANEEGKSIVVKTGAAKIHSAQLVCSDKNCHHLKGLVIHTEDRLRIALLNVRKLKNVIKYHPQWVANSNTAYKGKGKYYYLKIDQMPEVWLGVANKKVSQVGIKTK